MLLASTFFGCTTGGPVQQLVYRSLDAPGFAVGAPAQATLLEARQLDRQGQEAAVDLYFRAAIQAAYALSTLPGASAGAGYDEDVYRQALAGLIDAGQRYGRLDPRQRLIVVDGGRRVVPIRYVGFAWQPRDFSRLTPVEGQVTRDIAHRYAQCGLGLPLVGERVATCPDEMFFRPWQPFAVTAVLRPAMGVTDESGMALVSEAVLEFYNPLAFDTIAWSGASYPLASDLTAPWASIVNKAPRQYLRGFTAPSDTAVRQQLVMVEPYQRGKIPVVFIHGLYSDPITWVDMANELRAQHDLYDRYQFWTYRYPTGGDLMESAAILRKRLRQARDTFDRQHTDPALDAMVLVGHSLGGLVSKLQVTSSQDLLWRAAAEQPFDALRAPPALEARLARSFFFEPVPMVKRVIFIGTPHGGSGMTRRLAGRLGSALVNFGTEDDDAYQQLIADNPDVFKPIVERRRPTTIDLLEPSSPFLAALKQLPVNCATHLHSIIGTGGANPLVEPGDGVVPVSSARHYGDSEVHVPAKHEKLQRDPASINEIARILRLHAAEFSTAIVARSGPGG